MIKQPILLKGKFQDMNQPKQKNENLDKTDANLDKTI